MARRSRGRRNGVRGFFAYHPGVLVGIVLVVLAAAAVVAGKVLADRAATEQTQQRAAEVRRLLRGATPEDFLAANAGERTSGDVADRVRAEPDFQDVQATARVGFIRFQPDGWWAGFTERCVVAEVRAGGVVVRVPKTACVRVGVPED